MKLFKSFLLALNGLKTVWLEERNFRIEIIAAVFVLVGTFVLNFSLIEIGLIVIAIVLVTSAEIINTAIEDLCDKIEPNQNSVIGKIKDTMAAFVLVSACGASALGIIVILHHFVMP